MIMSETTSNLIVNSIVDIEDSNYEVLSLREAMCTFVAMGDGTVGFAEETDCKPQILIPGAPPIVLSQKTLLNGNGLEVTIVDGVMVGAGNVFNLNKLSVYGAVAGGFHGNNRERQNMTLTLDNVAVFGSVYGGNIDENGDISKLGNVSVALNNCQLDADSWIYGIGDAGDVTAANVSIAIVGTNGNGASIAGGGKLASAAEVKCDDINISIDAGHWNNVFSGGVAQGGKPASSFKVAQTVKTTISGGVFDGYVSNGSFAVTSIQGASTFNISGGVFNGQVSAGGFSSGSMATVNGNVILNISGGNFNDYVFGGCGATSGDASSTRIVGSTSVTVNCQDNRVVFGPEGDGDEAKAWQGGLYAGSAGKGNINTPGNSSIAFTGDGRNLYFNRNAVVSGRSQLVEESGAPYVTGTRTLAFQNYTGAFGARINDDFTDYVSANGSYVVFTNYVDLSSVTKWSISVDDIMPEIIWKNGQNNFAGDTIEITVEGELPNNDYWTVICGNDQTISGLERARTVTINGTAAIYDSVNGRWQTANHVLFVENGSLMVAGNGVSRGPRANNADNVYYAPNVTLVTADGTWNNWVGEMDVVDYSKFSLDEEAYLNLSLLTTDAAQIKLYRNDGTTVVYSGQLDAAGILYADPIKLQAGVYYVSVGTSSSDVYFSVDFKTEEVVEAPAAPVVHVDRREGLTHSALVTADFDSNAVVRQYSFDGENWHNYTAPLLVTENANLRFRGYDKYGNCSGEEITECVVDGIYRPVVYRDSVGRDGNLSDSHDLSIDTAGMYFVEAVIGGNLKGSVTITKDGKSVAKGTIAKGVLKFNSGKSVLLEKGDYVITISNTDKGKTSGDYVLSVNANKVFDKGNNADDVYNGEGVTVHDQAAGNADWVGFGDLVDYQIVDLATAAKLSFDLNATDASKFAIYKLVTKNGVNSLKSVQATTLKANKEKTEYSAVTKSLLLEQGTYYISMTSTNGKKGGDADYSVKLNSNTVYFDKDDGLDDNAFDGADVTVENAFVPGEEWTGWVGFGDVSDYKMLNLDTAANLQFNVTATDTSKFVIYELKEKIKDGVVTYSVKSVQSTTLKLNKGTGEYEATSKELLLNKGQYFIAMTSTNAKKGGDADYAVKVSDAYKSLPAGDNSDDTYKLVIDSDAVALDAPVNGWVGFGDKADFFKVVLDEADKQLVLSFDEATEEAIRNKQLKVTLVNASGKSQSLAWNGDNEYVTKLLADGEYFVGITTANVKKYYDISYQVEVGKL